MDLITYNLQVWTDIIFPAANLFVIIFIGGYLAFLLNRKSNKDKIKEILIDTFMEFTQKSKNYIIVDSANLLCRIYIVLRDTVRYSDNNLSPEALFKKRFQDLIDDLTKEYKIEVFDDSTYFKFYFHKFCFLLGEKRYNKKIRPVQEKVLRLDSDRNKVTERIIKTVTLNEETVNIMDNHLYSFNDEEWNQFLSDLNHHFSIQYMLEKTNVYNEYREAVSKEIHKF